MRDDDPTREPPPDSTDRSSGESDLRFRDIVGALSADDPVFARRCSAPAPGTPTAGTVAVALGIVATLLLGLLPLAVGVWTSGVILIGFGAVHTLVLPVLVPLSVVALLEHRRPLWT